MRRRAADSDSAHPLLGHRLRLAGTSELRFESSVRADSPGFLRDHRVFGEAMFPAAAYLELAFAAARTEEPSRPIELRDVGFQRPLILSDDRDTTIQTVLIASETDQRRFQIFSRMGSADGADDDRWVLHCSGLLTVPAETAAAGPVLDSLQGALVESVSPGDIYEQCRLRGDRSLQQRLPLRVERELVAQALPERRFERRRAGSELRQQREAFAQSRQVARPRGLERDARGDPFDVAEAA